ncbi:glycosyltransferase family 4 protein [Archaeoglobus neptunius]|uniref:glycosyltransferase family 4 protein n=1 Tax=Archaeoglobus neptunius TaxID=2798580 RepID=UPI0019259C13|nr:glycosyltransferase family 4 protein [Archaeoglobus neptunius]
MDILVISPHYHTFVKGLVDATAKYVSSISIFVHHNFLSELARYLPFSYFKNIKKFSRKELIYLENSPENVRVNTVSTLYFIPDGKNTGLGDMLFKKFSRYIIEHEIEFSLIHAHFIWPCGYAAVKLGEEFGVPVVVTAHGYDVYDLPFRSRKWFNKVKFTLENASHIITVSRRNYEIIVHKIGIPEMNVSVVPNGVDLKLFRPVEKHVARNRLGIPQNKKVILNVANLVPVKGHKYLVKAMRKISENSDDVILYIVGDGNLKKELQKEVKKLNLEGVVKLVGAKPHSEIPLWMNAADIFVLPSLNEGNPTVMFEALGVGLPFVGTKVGGIPEIITSEDYGFLSEPGNADDLAEKILIAIKKEWDRGRIRRYGEQFSWENIAKCIVQIYERIV